MANSKIRQVNIAWEVGQGGLYRMLGAKKVCNFVSLHRFAFLEGVQYLVHDHRLGVREFEGVFHGVLELRCFSSQIVEEHDAPSVCFLMHGESKNDTWACLLFMLGS